ncbi:MAG: pyridoxamine kinase [Clostridia bacterium]|nr:pyridoxamine kinase [Clostridia bacterium]
MKRILTIQDISCVGKCSLTVALPIISAFGVETAILPTAVLSNHTQFKGFTFRDLTCDIKPIADKWQQENITFNAIYTGFLGSKEQIELVANLFDDFKKDRDFILVDPAMADNGVMYKCFDTEFAKEMAKLCAKADYIVPNLTEASFMLGTPYKENYDEKYIQDMLIKLTDMGAKNALLTGVSFEENKLGAYGYNKETKKFYSYFREKLPVSFHGTGDIFASAFCGALTIGKTDLEASKIAVDFTVESMIKTMENKNHNWYGVDFESAFPFLINRIK